MVPKYGKENKRRSQRDVRAIQMPEPDDSAYQPPSRDNCTDNQWRESHDDYIFVVRCWYQNSKLVDFQVNLYRDVPAYPNGIGPCVASGDCKNHGSFHAHDERHGHGPHHDIQPLKSRRDVETAFTISTVELLAFVASIREQGEEYGNDDRS